jgi:RNA polymerase sigma-70 factor (ECF subfamily)
VSSERERRLGGDSVIADISSSIVCTNDNAAVARGLKSHDPEILHELIETYQHRLMRYLMYLTQRRDEAEDVFQEVWLRVLRSGSTYNGTSSFETWLCAIARNLVVDLRRRRPVASLDEMRGTEDNESCFEVTDARPSALEQVQVQEDAADLSTVMQSLDTTHREVLMLRYREELGLEEIARVTQVPLSTVKSRLYRGVAILKTRLEALRNPADSPAKPSR